MGIDGLQQVASPSEGCLDDLLTRHPIEGQEGCSVDDGFHTLQTCTDAGGIEKVHRDHLKPLLSVREALQERRTPFHPFSHSNTMASVERLLRDMASDVTCRSGDQDDHVNPNRWTRDEA